MVKKYNNHLNQAINLENILQHLSDLYEKGTVELTVEQQTELNNIDKKLTKAMQAAKQHYRKKCRKSAMDTSSYPSHPPDPILEGSEETTRTRTYLQFGPTQMHASRSGGIFTGPYRVRTTSY